MSHTVFQTTQIIPVNPNRAISSCKPGLPLRGPASCPMLLRPGSGRLRNRSFVVRASSSGLVSVADAIARLERCFVESPGGVSSDSTSAASTSSSNTSMSMPVMKGKYGAFGAVTLEKSKLDMSQKQTQSTPEIATGGGGGDIGKKNSHGGGDGGDDDGGDDDDYNDNFDDGDEGDEGGFFRRRIIHPELFDRKFVDCVLNEWQKTMMDLPAGLRQAYEMGLVSSAQMVRFLVADARPTAERFISRALPEGLSRAFNGRRMADPAFLHKLAIEQAASIIISGLREWNHRKDRIKQEWDLALINILTVSACNALVVWSLAPCRSYGNTFRYDLQNTLQKLPNNIFEQSYPLREFDLQKRIQSFFVKAAELCMIGSVAGAAQGALSNFVASKKEKRLSVTVPNLSTNSLGYGGFLGLYANLRYQLLFGIDRAFTNHFDVIGVALFLSTTLRVLNIQLGEASRWAWLGVEADPLAQSEDLLKAYTRPTEPVNMPSSKWFISKNAVVSGLGLLGFKQGNQTDGEAGPPKQRRKRIVRKKVTTSSV